MRITVKGEKDFTLRLPTGLVLNRFTAFLASRRIVAEGISPRQLLKLMKAVRSYKRLHLDWMLLEAESASGEKIIIQL